MKFPKIEVEIKTRNGQFVEGRSDLCTVVSRGYLPYEAGEKLVLLVSLLMGGSLDDETGEELLQLLKELIEIKKQVIRTGVSTELIPLRTGEDKKTLADQIFDVLNDHSGELMSVPAIAKEMFGNSIVIDGKISDNSKYTKVYIPLTSLVKKGKVQKKKLSKTQLDSEGAMVQVMYYVPKKDKMENEFVAQ